MTLTPHSIIHGDAYFAYFNKIWGIPRESDVARETDAPRSLTNCIHGLP